MWAALTIDRAVPLGRASTRRAAWVVCTAACLGLGCGPTNVVKQLPPGSSDADAGAHGDGGADDGYVSMASDPACDLGGVWVARQTTFAHGLVDTTNGNWYFLELKQVGDEVEVLDHFDCGLRVDSPAVTITMPDKTELLLATVNTQVGRKGTIKRNGARCDVVLDRFWSVRGANIADYLPRGPHDPRDVDELEAEAPLPTKENPEGSFDQDEDGNPGITLKVGNNDARYSVQRDWLEWFTCNGTADDPPKCQPGNENDYGIMASEDLSGFWLRSDFNNQDFPLGSTNPLYEMNGTPVRNKNNRVEFRLLGRTRMADKVVQFLGLADVKAQCAQLRLLMPLEEVSE
jgi:hypothetical protein